MEYTIRLIEALSPLILGFRISGAMLGLVAAGPPRAVPDDGCGVM